MKAIILCAGLGERLRPLTETIPKPMVPIDGKPALEYLIKLCKKHNISKIGINTSYLPEKIKEYFGDGKDLGVEIVYSFEPTLLGTAGALNNFKDFCNETLIVIYGDNITDLDLTNMLNFHRENNSKATLFLHKQELTDSKTTPGVVLFDEKNKIHKIIENISPEEKANLDPSLNKEFSNSGIYILEPEVLDLIKEGYSDFAKNIFPEALNKRLNFFAYYPKCYFIEIGQMQRYLKARQEIESGKIKLNF